MLKLSSDAFSKYFPFLNMTVNLSQIKHLVTEASKMQATRRSAKDQQEEEIVVSESIQVTQRPGSPLHSTSISSNQQPNTICCLNMEFHSL